MSPVSFLKIGSRGILYRAGPGGHQVKTHKNEIYGASHWFDGFSQAHRFVLNPSTDGKYVSEVVHNSRHTCDMMIESIKKTGELGKISFGQKYDPCESFFKKVMSTFQAVTAGKPTNAADANVGVTVAANLPMPDHMVDTGDGKTNSRNIETLCIRTDTSTVQLMDPKTLEPLEVPRQEHLHPALKGPFSAAHARTDPLTGDWYNFNMELGGRATYRVFKVSAKTGDVTMLATINGADIRPAYIHSFMMTERYLVLCIYAAHLARGGMAVLWLKNMLEALQFDTKKKNIWLVIDRLGDKGVVGAYESEAFFAFHPVNAWEQTSTTDSDQVDIFMDIPTYPNIDVLKRFYYENLKATSPDALNYANDNKNRGRSSLTRFKIPNVGTSTRPVVGDRGQVEKVFEVPSQDSMELPSFNPRYACKPSRYIWGVSDRGQSTFIDGLTKLDTETKEVKFWSVHAHSPGEPIFLPDPKGTDEDDGVCLSVVLDGTKGKSYLLVLDAKSFEEVGRAEMDTAVGFGFHGLHIGH